MADWNSGKNFGSCFHSTVWGCVPVVIQDNIPVGYMKCVTGGTEVLLWHAVSVPRRPQCPHKTMMSWNSNLWPSHINHLVRGAKMKIYMCKFHSGSSVACLSIIPALEDTCRYTRSMLVWDFKQRWMVSLLPTSPRRIGLLDLWRDRWDVPKLWLWTTNLCCSNTRKEQISFTLWHKPDISRICMSLLVLVSTVVIRVNVFENDETALGKMHHTIRLVCRLLNTVITFIRYRTRMHLT